MTWPVAPMQRLLDEETERKEGDALHGEHESAIEGKAQPAEPGLAQIDKIEPGGMEMCRRKVFSVFGLTLVLGALLAGCAGETASGNVRPGPAGPGAGRVVMKDEVFEPDVLEVPASSPVTLEVSNAGEENHNLTIDDLDTSTGAMQSGDVVTVTFTAPKGTTEFRCTWHPDMVGRIVAT